MDAWARLLAPHPTVHKPIVAKGHTTESYGLQVQESFGVDVVYGQTNWHLPPGSWEHTETFGATEIPFHEWHHVALPWDHGELNLYLDGLLESSLDKGFVVYPTNEPLYIGANFPGGDEFLLGQVDEVRLWSRVLSEAELAAHHDDPADATGPALVAHWAFDEGAGQTAFDSSGNDLHLQLGSSPGPDGADPVWVADDPPLAGGRIVFRSLRSGYSEIWVMNQDGSDQTQLTDLQAFVSFAPAWSPDGKRISFVSRQVQSDPQDLFVMDSDGSNIEKLVPMSAVGGIPIVSSSWSPDGSKLVVVTHQGCCEGGVWIVDSDGSHLTQIFGGTFVGQADFSGDGSRIVFNPRANSLSFSHRLWTMKPDGTDLFLVTPPCCSESTAAGNHDWAPRLSRLLVDFGHNIWTMDPDGQNRLQLTTGGTWPPSPFLFADPVWSPDGTKIAYQYHSTDSGSDIWTMDADGSNRVRLTSTGDNRSPDWIDGPLNRPPVALCRDAEVIAGSDCTALASVDDGSFDPDGDAVTVTQDPSGPYPLGNTSVTLTVEDEHGASDSCEATVTVADEAAPVVECDAPATINPPDAPVSFTATASDNCGVADLEIVEYDCFVYNPSGRRVDKTRSCEVGIEDATITILDSGGVGDVITWMITAMDIGGNSLTRECRVEVVNPGRGR